MKKLTNISPFLLLLVPVFMMMILSMTTSISDNGNMAMNKAAKNITVAKVMPSALK